MSARYSIYFAPPPESELWQFAASWLGRDPASNADVPQPVIEGLPADRLAQITASPRHYGFHATLKPPFELAKTGREVEFLAEVKRFAESYPRFTARPLRLSSLAGFLALTLSVPSAEMNALATACVETFDPFRAPATDEELARRRAGKLTPRQDELLTRWGYPYVFDEFRFHMTLTGRLDDRERSEVEEVLRPLVAPFCEDPLPIDAIALYQQKSSEEPFYIRASWPLAR